MTIEYTGERGQDVGGLTRDFFCELSKEMFKSGTALFQISDQGSTYMPNPKSRVQPDHLRYFSFVGRVVGKALFEGCSVECYFVRSMYKMMIGQRLSFTDLEDLDHHLYDGLKWCLEAERTAEEVESLYETFSVDVEHFGRKEVVDLIPGGRDTCLINTQAPRPLAATSKEKGGKPHTRDIQNGQLLQREYFRHVIFELVL